MEAAIHTIPFYERSCTEARALTLAIIALTTLHAILLPRLNKKMSIQHCARLLLIIYVPPSSMSRRLIVMHCFVRSLTSPVMVHGLARMSLLRLRNTCNVSSMFTSLPARPLRVYTLRFINLRSAQPHRHFSSYSTSRAIFARFATWTLLIKLVMTTLSRFLAAKVVLTYLKVTALAQLII